MYIYARRRSILLLLFSAHLHRELTGWAFTLRMKPFDEIEIDIKGGVLEGTKIEESLVTTLGHHVRLE